MPNDRAKLVAQILTDNGIPVYSPDERSLDDVESERWRACLEIARRLGEETDDAAVQKRRAQVVHERHNGFDASSGPWEAARVGFRIGNRVFWTGCYSSPGTPGSYDLDAALASEIVKRWNT